MERFSRLPSKPSHNSNPPGSDEVLEKVDAFGPSGTPRQLDVLHKACRSGYFGSPRVEIDKELAIMGTSH